MEALRSRSTECNRMASPNTETRIQPKHLIPSRSRIQPQHLTSRSLKDTTLETMEVTDTIDKDTIKETRIQPQHLTSKIQPKLLNTPRIQPMHLTSRSRRRSLGMEVS